MKKVAAVRLREVLEQSTKGAAVVESAAHAAKDWEEREDLERAKAAFDIATHILQVAVNSHEES